MSQHRQSLGRLPISGGGPLSSHPTSPVEISAFAWPEEKTRATAAAAAATRTRTGRSKSSLPFLGPNSSTTFCFQPANLSSPNLSCLPDLIDDSRLPDLTNDSHSSNHSLDVHDSFSAALDTSFSNTSVSTQLTSHPPPSRDFSKVSTMSSHDNRHDSLHSSLPPPTPTLLPPGSSAGSTSRRDSKGVRKLFTLAGLRNSFSTSRSSLVISNPIPQSQSQSPSQPQQEESRPHTSSTSSSRGVKRAAEDDEPMTNHNNQMLQPPLRKRKSGSWFRRKSMLMFGSHGPAISPSAVDDTEMPLPLGPDAMMVDPPDTRPTTEHTDRSNYSSSQPPSSLYQNAPDDPPMLPPLSPLSVSAPRSSEDQEEEQHEQPLPVSSPPQSPSNHPSASPQQQYTSSSPPEQRFKPSYSQPQFKPPSRETFSPPPTLPEFGNFGSSFEGMDTDMFASFGR